MIDVFSTIVFKQKSTSEGMICFGASDSVGCEVTADRLDDESALSISLFCLSDKEEVLEDVVAAVVDDDDAEREFEGLKTDENDDDDDEEEEEEERERGL